MRLGRSLALPLFVLPLLALPLLTPALIVPRARPPNFPLSTYFECVIMSLRNLVLLARLTAAEALYAAHGAVNSPSTGATQPCQLAALEDRVLFSATAAPPPDADLAAVTQSSQFQNLVEQATADSPPSSEQVGEAAGDEATGQSAPADPVKPANSLQETDAPDVASNAETRSQELVFVDRGVENYEQLLGDLLAYDDPVRDLQVVLLSAERDGIEQITEALAGRIDLDAVHFVSHGTDRAVKLGATWLSLDNLDAYAGDIAAWANVLSSEANLLVLRLRSGQQ